MRREDELLAAYVDGVTELTAEERRHVEELLARDPALRTAETETRAMLEQLRSLPPEGTEPDWGAMERAIRDEVGAAVPRAWWRPAWRWLVPASALTLAAAVFALWIHERAPVEAPIVSLPADAGAPLAPPAAEATTMSLWLDGQEVEIDLDADELFEDEGELLGEEDSLTPGLLPVDNLAWIDELDESDIDVADAWLGRKKG
jgi:anti-sigma factor RsiW